MVPLIGTSLAWIPFPSLAIGRGTDDSGADITFDEATFSTVSRSADWLLASFNNQKQSSDYLNFDSLVGPISLNDDEYTKILRQEGHRHYSYTVAHSGSGSFTATGLPPGLVHQFRHRVISGSTSVTGSQNVTITATGPLRRWKQVTVTKVYIVSITDPPPSPSAWILPSPDTPVPPPLPTSLCLYP